MELKAIYGISYLLIGIVSNDIIFLTIYEEKGEISIFKKTIISFVLITFFLASFSLFSNSFSQPDIRFRVLRRNEELYIRILTPVNIKNIDVKFYNSESDLIGVVSRDYYGIITENDIQFNEFILSNSKVAFSKDSIIRLNTRNGLHLEKAISAIPMKDIYENNNKTPKSLKIMTFNIHHGRDKVGNSNLNQIIELIKQEEPDIVGLQELDKGMLRTNFEEQIKILADGLSLNYIYGPNVTYLSGKYGNGILSKYPILDWQNIRMEGKETRGLLRADIIVDDRKINFMVTHLGLDESERDKQYKILDSYLEIYNTDSIVVGDFNTRHDNHNIINLSNKLDDIAVKTSYKYKPTLNIYQNKFRVDYIFTSKGTNIKSYKVGVEDFSDHYPVTTNIVLK